MALGRKRKVALITSGVLLCILFAGFVALVLDSQSNRVRVTISKETTYITEPLRPDGYPDYIGYLNRRLSEGVTPENNSAVLFWQAMGPKPIKPELRERFFQMLGIPVPPETGDYFIESLDFQKSYISRFRVEGKIAADQSEEDLDQKFFHQQLEIMQRPWSKDEFPVWTEWLALNEKPLALLVEATKRPRRYDPLVPEGEDRILFGIGIEFSATMRSRDVARALIARSMLRIHEGRVEEAWQDLLAIHRLGRLISQGSTLVEELVATTLDGIALRGDQAVVQQGKLPSTQLLYMRDELAKLPPMPIFADVMDISERLYFLDCVTMMARKGPGFIYDIQNSVAIADIQNSETREASKKGILQSLCESIAKSTVNWDIVLRISNCYFDRIVADMRKPTRAERIAAANAYDDDLQKLEASANDKKAFAFSLLCGPRKAISQQVGNGLVLWFLSALWRNVPEAEDRAKMQFDLTLLAFALAAYRADNGAYPEKLEQLMPKYTAELPKDIFNSDAALQYSRTNDGYLLYSFGPNGRDDGGRTQDDRPEGSDADDLAVRVPSKPA